jgi:regulatory protein
MSEVLESACRYLALREHSAGELRRKLAVKQFDSEEIDAVIDRLISEGMIDDRRFADAFTRTRVSKLQGPRKIRAELMRRCVGQAEINAALDEEKLCWSDIAAEWLARQRGESDDFDTRAKYYRRLVNRGFSHDQAMDALSGRRTSNDQ